MKETTHLIPVGHTPTTLIESLRRYPVSKIILILGNKPHIKSEQKARETAEKIQKALGNTPCEKLILDDEDVTISALKITEKINQIKQKGHKTMVNLSGSLRTLNTAAYIASTLTQTPAYAGIPSYNKKGEINAIREIINIPLLPLKQNSKTKQKILNEIKKQETTTLEHLTKKIKPKHKNKANEKSRLSHHLKDLRIQGYITTKKKGRQLHIQLTDTGKLYMQAQNN